MIGGVAATPKERRNTRSGSRKGLCVETQHIAGSCQGCARNVGNLAHVVEDETAELKILCGDCCPCASAKIQHNRPSPGQGMDS